MIRLIPLLLLTFFAQPALAHKVIFDAYASGPMIEGELGLSNGEMAANHPIFVMTPDGTPLGATTTDADGFFAFLPERAVVHVFRADLGAGLRLRQTFSEAKLPEPTLRLGAPIEGGDASPGT